MTLIAAGELHHASSTQSLAQDLHTHIHLTTSKGIKSVDIHNPTLYLEDPLIV